MGAGAAILTTLRVLGVMVALAVVGLGAWDIIMVHDVEVRGSVILDAVNIPQDKEDAWQSFFDAVVNSQTRIWIAIAAGCFTSLTMILILLSYRLERMRMSPFLLVPLEFLSMGSMAAAFGATMSTALTFNSLQTPTLEQTPSPDLMAFAMLFPLSKGYAIGSGAGGFILLCTFIAALIQAVRHARDSKACSFEPTASALGMSHEYQAVTPRNSKGRGPIPTLYDPEKPFPGSEFAQPGDEEKGFAYAGAEMGRSGSEASQGGQDSGAISGPLGLLKPENVAQMRPAHRPWSELPKRR